MYGPHLGPFPFELTENMRIGIVCKVIDNFGDAGFSLRLAKALALEGHSVTLFHDSSTTFNVLIPDQNIHGLELVDATQGLGKAENTQLFDLLLEPFGSSSEQTAHRFDLRLKKTHHSTPWLLIDYLSSEDWVENFHLQSSVDPKSGHVTTFFYPGFTPRTGGLIHADFPSHLRDGQEKTEEDGLKVFVFAYSNAPVLDLLVSCETANKTGAEIQIGLASWKWPTGESSTKFQCMTPLPFCPQSEFDDLLARYDVLFVRGEDSFVRAQLAGKPFIWQIYATQDNAHAAKLAGDQVRLRQFADAHGEIEAAFDQVHLAVAGAQVQLDVRIPRTHGIDQRQCQHRRGGRWQTDADIAAHAPAMGGHDRVFRLAQGQLSMMEKADPGAGGCHAGRGSIQQAHTQFAFQLGDLLAQGRHPDVQLQRRPPEAAKLDDFYEIAQLSQFQCGCSSRICNSNT